MAFDLLREAERSQHRWCGPRHSPTDAARSKRVISKRALPDRQSCMAKQRQRVCLALVAIQDFKYLARL